MSAKVINYTRRMNSEILKSIKKKYKPGTLEYLVAVVDSFDDVSDLKREKLTVADYRALVEVKKDMVDFYGGVDYHYQSLIFTSIALKDFFERHGFIVVPNYDVGGWNVSCIKQV